jgi:hypothetical protein
MPNEVEAIRERLQLATETTEDTGSLIHQLALHDVPALLAIVERLESGAATESLNTRLTEARAVRAKAMQLAELYRTALLSIAHFWGDQTDTLPQAARRIALQARQALQNAERIISQEESTQS